MSSPFAKKFLGKKPFTSDKRKEKDYEEIGDEARRLEEKYSADRGDAPDYEARLMVQKELAKKNEANNESPLNGAYASGADGMKYVSILPHIQKLQKSSSDMAINSENKKWDKKIDKAVDSDEEFMRSGPGKDMSEKGVESRLFETPKVFGKNEAKPYDIQDIDVYEIEDGF